MVMNFELLGRQEIFLQLGSDQLLNKDPMEKRIFEKGLPSLEHTD
jgi:hypothetical protein